MNNEEVALARKRADDQIQYDADTFSKLSTNLLKKPTTAHSSVRPLRMAESLLTHTNHASSKMLLLKGALN